MNNILKIPTKVLLRTFNIDFSYTTARNNKRMRTVEIKATSPEDAQYWLSNWIRAFNDNNPHKPYLNEQILRCEEVDRLILEI